MSVTLTCECWKRSSFKSHTHVCGPSWSYYHQLVSSWRVGRVLRCQETPTSGKEQVRPPHLPQAPVPSKVKGCFSNVPCLLSLLSFAHYGMPVAMVMRKKGGTGAGEDAKNPASPTAFLLSPDTSALSHPPQPCRLPHLHVTGPALCPSRPPPVPPPQDTPGQTPRFLSPPQRSA